MRSGVGAFNVDEGSDTNESRPLVSFSGGAETSWRSATASVDEMGHITDSSTGAAGGSGSHVRGGGSGDSAESSRKARRRRRGWFDSLSTNVQILTLLAGAFLSFGIVGMAASISQVRTKQDVPYPADYKLVLVQNIFRHGARSPLRALPESMERVWNCSHGPLVTNDAVLPQDSLVVPSKHRKKCSGMVPSSLVYKVNRMPTPGTPQLPGTCALGQLLDEGYEQLRKVGDTLRVRYVSRNNFPETLDPDAMYVRSTDFPRTIASLQALLSGFYPESSRKLGVDSALTINVGDIRTDDLFPNPERCPRLNALEKEITQSAEYQRGFQAKFSNLAQRIERVFQGKGMQPTFLQLFDILSAHHFATGRYPPGFSSELASDILAAAEYHYKQVFGTVEYQSLAVGSLLNTLVSNMIDFQDAMTSQLPAQMHLYSAHDSTLAGLLSVLRIYETWPDYASMLTLELFMKPMEELEKEWHFRVIYNNKPVTIPGCVQDQKNNICTLRILKDRLKSLDSIEKISQACSQ